MHEWGTLESRGQTIHTHLIQLLMSLECDVWIGTRASNWNRLIDELRCTWIDKCNGLYIEVGDISEGDFEW